MHDRNKDCLAALREGKTGTWIRPRISGADALGHVISGGDVDAAAERFVRFAPILTMLFTSGAWDGHIVSELLDFHGPDDANWLVKGDHALPMTGSIKARGVHELLCIVEQIALSNNLSLDRLTTPEARSILGSYRVVVASTGNLGYSIGVVGRAFGLVAEIHMSADAKAWKKDRLRDIGADVVEHACDYSETIARARVAAENRRDTMFVDDEGSRHLLTGYAVAADELARQLDARGVRVDAETPLVVYLPCGVGGAPGGITYGLKRRFGDAVATVFVEPVASPCVMVALASGLASPPSVYQFGCDNGTIADGLAVPRASALMLDAVGEAIDAVVAVTDSAMLDWVRTAWNRSALRLEPSAAAAFAAHAPFNLAAKHEPEWPRLDRATHLFWATGGSKVPDPEFTALLSPDYADAEG